VNEIDHGHKRKKTHCFATAILLRESYVFDNMVVPSFLLLLIDFTPHYYDCKALFTRYNLTHNIAIKKNIFEPWMSKGQGKLLKKKSRYIKQTQIKVCFKTVYLGWSIETCVSKLSFYHIFFYLFIAILCVKMYRVNKV